MHLSGLQCTCSEQDGGGCCGQSLPGACGGSAASHTHSSGLKGGGGLNRFHKCTVYRQIPGRPAALTHPDHTREPALVLVRSWLAGAALHKLVGTAAARPEACEEEGAE